MQHTVITAAATIPHWHETATVKRILGEMACDGFAASCPTTFRGIWEDRAIREYDRDDRWVRALIAAREMWFETVGEAHWPTADHVSADEVIERAECRHDWIETFEATIAQIDTEWLPYGNDISKAAREGDFSTDPVAAAQRFYADWEAGRQARVAALREMAA